MRGVLRCHGPNYLFDSYLRLLNNGFRYFCIEKPDAASARSSCFCSDTLGWHRTGRALRACGYGFVAIASAAEPMQAQFAHAAQVALCLQKQRVQHILRRQGALASAGLPAQKVCFIRCVGIAACNQALRAIRKAVQVVRVVIVIQAGPVRPAGVDVVGALDMHGDWCLHEMVERQPAQRGRLQ